MIIFSVDYSLTKPCMTVFQTTGAANAAKSVSIYLFPSKISQKTKNTLSSYNIIVDEQDLPINARKGDEVGTLIRGKHLSNSMCKTISFYKNQYPNEEILLLIEGASYNSSGSSSLDLIGGKFVFLNDAMNLVYNIIAIPPTTVKKHITGKGNATKSEVIEAIGRLKPYKHPLFEAIGKKNSDLFTAEGNPITGLDDICDSVSLLVTYFSIAH